MATMVSPMTGREVAPVARNAGGSKLRDFIVKALVFVVAWAAFVGLLLAGCYFGFGFTFLDSLGFSLGFGSIIGMLSGILLGANAMLESGM